MLPREKLRMKGPASLSDIELLRALIGSGNAYSNVNKIASAVAKVISNCGSDVRYDDLCAVQGLGPAKISEILAAIELSRRMLEAPAQPIVDSPAKAFELLRDLGSKQREHFVVLTLDGANRLIDRHTVSIGTLTTSLVHPREVFAPAIADHAASVLLGHNHPSGNLSISADDRSTNRRLIEVGETIGISVIDHFVVAGRSFVTIS